MSVAISSHFFFHHIYTHNRRRSHRQNTDNPAQAHNDTDAMRMNLQAINVWTGNGMMYCHRIEAN